MPHLQSGWLCLSAAGRLGSSGAAVRQLCPRTGRWGTGISYFGIEFISSLTTAQAQQTAAMNLALSVVQNKPKLDVRIKDEVKTVTTTPQSASVQGAGLVQVVQLEGSGNSSVNQAGITLTPPAMTGQSWHSQLPGLGQLRRVATKLLRRTSPAGTEPERHRLQPRSVAVQQGQGRRIADPESDPDLVLSLTAGESHGLNYKKG